MLQERALSTWAKRLQYYVYETVGGIRMGQFFDIVTDLPESQPALADVRECLKHTSSHARFIQRFSAAIKQRLLHPGAVFSFARGRDALPIYGRGLHAAACGTPSNGGRLAVKSLLTCSRYSVRLQ